MTDEELDLARAKEAMRRNGLHSPVGPASAVTVAARLAREGWVPEDPLWAEAREIASTAPGRLHCEDGMVNVALAALRRGIEIGRGG